ncbi:DUF4350 domain-containing protein [Natrialbaceae archaeon A-chndr2]
MTADSDRSSSDAPAVLESLTSSRLSWPTVLLAVLVLVTLGALVVGGSTSTTAFGPYNPSWDGASNFQSALDDDPEVEASLIQDTNRYADLEPENTVAFVIAPEETYDDESAADVARFVEAGGTLVVLENFEPQGNALLEDVGASARVDGQVIRDDEYYFRGPTMPVATGVENHTLTADVEQLTLNYATAVEPSNATTLVTTSDFAYRVDDPDEELDDDKELERLPVATIESVEDGRVVVIGDPSITTNAMRDEPDNEVFLTALAREGNTAVVDVSHSDGIPPLTAALLVLRGSVFLQALLGFVGIGLIALFSSGRLTRERLPVGRRRRSVQAAEESTPTLSDVERATLLRERHPDWDDERIERMITVFNQRDSKGGQHERD